MPKSNIQQDEQDNSTTTVPLTHISKQQSPSTAHETREKLTQLHQHNSPGYLLTNENVSSPSVTAKRTAKNTITPQQPYNQIESPNEHTTLDMPDKNKKHFPITMQPTHYINNSHPITPSQVKSYPIYATVQVLINHLDQTLKFIDNQKEHLSLSYDRLLRYREKVKSVEIKKEIDKQLALSTDLELQVDKGIEILKNYKKELGYPNVSKITPKQIYVATFLLVTLASVTSGTVNSIWDMVTGKLDLAKTRNASLAVPNITQEEIQQINKDYYSSQSQATSTGVGGVLQALAGMFFITYFSFAVVRHLATAVWQWCHDYDPNLLPTSDRMSVSGEAARNFLNPGDEGYTVLIKKIKDYFTKEANFPLPDIDENLYDPDQCQEHFNKLQETYQAIINASKQAVVRIRNENRHPDRRERATIYVTEQLNNIQQQNHEASNFIDSHSNTSTLRQRTTHQRHHAQSEKYK